MNLSDTADTYFARGLSDHAGDFSFNIHWKGNEFKIDIWAKKVNAYFELTKILNGLLPATLKIGYTAAYFEQ